jgi:hypothetical protein
MYRMIRKAQPESELDGAKLFRQKTACGLPLDSDDRVAIEQSQPGLGFSDGPNDQFHMRSGIRRRKSQEQQEKFRPQTGPVTDSKCSCGMNRPTITMHPLKGSVDL